MAIDYSLIMKVLEMQIADIYSHIERKRMQAPAYLKMKERIADYLENLPRTHETYARYKLVNQHSQYLFGYLVNLLTKEAQRKGSDEGIRVRSWDRGNVGYKNSLRNVASPKLKHALAEVSPLPFDPNSPAVINQHYRHFQKTPNFRRTTRTLWQLDGDRFLSEHAHVLILELAELMYPGIVILAAEFEHIGPSGLQFSIACRLIASYVYDVTMVIDHLLSDLTMSESSLLRKVLDRDSLTAEDLTSFLEGSRGRLLEEAELLASRYPKRDRMTSGITEEGERSYLSAIEFNHLESQLGDHVSTAYIRKIQLKATELARERSSRYHREIVLLNEYAGNVGYSQLLLDPVAFRYTGNCFIGAELKVYHRGHSGSVDLLLGRIDRDHGCFQPDFLIDRKAVSRFQLRFAARSDRAEIADYTIEPDLIFQPYEEDFRPLLHSVQTMTKEREYVNQLRIYQRGLVKTHDQHPLIALGVLYYDLSFSVEEVAAQERSLLVSLMHSSHMYKGTRLVMSHPDLPAVKLVLLGRGM